MLFSELTSLDRAHLVALTMQPGWSILVKMFEQQCEIATVKVIQLDPGVNNYDKQLASLQIAARATNDFCSSVLKSIDAHKEAYRAEKEDGEVVPKEAVENAEKMVSTFKQLAQKS